MHIFTLTVATLIVVLKTGPTKIRQTMDCHYYYLSSMFPSIQTLIIIETYSGA